MTVTLFEVGGHVRDSLLGIKSKDVDFAVETESTNMVDSWAELNTFLIEGGFAVFLSNIEFATIRARFPKGHVNAGLTADFVLCRKDGPSSDGRRPDFVEPGTLFDDLARRDFTVNAMARDMDGNLIDPWGGQGDLNLKRLRAVGNAAERFREDSLRALRAIRFEVTKDLHMDEEIIETLDEPWLWEAMSNVSAERRREEINKCFKHDTLRMLTIMGEFPGLFDAIFTDGLRLDATLAS